MFNGCSNRAKTSSDESPVRTGSGLAKALLWLSWIRRVTRSPLESARALLDVAVLNKEGIEIRLSKSLPADIDSAEADLKLAETELKRISQLSQQNAASGSELDRASNQVQTAKARIISLEASEKTMQAELKAAEAQVKSARQTVA